MLKKFTLLCCTFLLISLFPLKECFANQTQPPLDNLVHYKENLTSDEEIYISKKIQPLIENYFNWYNLNLKENLKNIDDLNSMLDNPTLLAFKKSKLNWFYNFHKQLELNLKSYTIDLDLIKIEFDDEFINVHVLYSEKLITENAEDFTQDLYDEKHILKIKNINGDYIIVNDYYSDDLMDENFSNKVEISSSDQEANNNLMMYTQNDISDSIIDSKMQEKELDYTERLNNINYLVNEIKAETEMTKLYSSITPYKYSGFNGSKAVEYAMLYAESPNPHFMYYPNGDCTNFVSQCIEYGGIPRGGTWYPGSRAWQVVDDFKNWASNTRYARILSWQENASLGDIVQFYNGSQWYHSMIITKKNSYNYLWVSGHTSNVKNKYLGDISSQKRFLLFTS